MKLTATLTNAQQAHAALTALWQQAKPWLVAGHRLNVEIFDGKSREQERLYHSCFRDIARDARFFGDRKLDEQSVKRLFIDAFYRATKDDPDYADDWKRRAPRMIPNLDGSGFVSMEPHSAEFTKNLARGFITFMHAWGDEHGVRWSPTSLGREWQEISA